MELGSEFPGQSGPLQLEFSGAVRLSVVSAPPPYRRRVLEQLSTEEPSPRQAWR